MDDDRATRKDEPAERTPGVPPHQPARDRRSDEADEVEESAEESFPSSDPPAGGGPGV